MGQGSGRIYFATADGRIALVRDRASPPSGREQVQGRPHFRLIRARNNDRDRAENVFISRAEGLMRFLSRIFRPQRRGESDIAFRRAMGVSSDLIRRMRETSNSNDAVRAVMSDIWAQSHNVPFMVTVFEAVQEAKSGPESAR